MAIRLPGWPLPRAVAGLGTDLELDVNGPLPLATSPGSSLTPRAKRGPGCTGPSIGC